jgi:hypothetical protein
VRYVVQMDFPHGLSGEVPDLWTRAYDDVAFQVVSELYGTPSDPIPVRRADEVYRSPPYEMGGRTQAVVVRPVA